MPSAQIIQLDHYRQSPTEQTPLTGIDKIRQLLKSATTAPAVTAAPLVIEIRLSADNEKLLIETLASRKIEGGVNG